MTTDPISALTVSSPDIWHRGLDLATSLTGYEYAPKLPLPDGTIYSCGGYWGPPVPYKDPAPPSPEQIKQDRIEQIDQEIQDVELEIDNHNKRIEEHKESIAERTRQIEGLRIKKSELEKQRQSIISAPRVFVPEGAMEWLLHEVGHWVAATPEERLLPDYGIPVDLSYDDKSQIKTTGFGYEREWQAWAFEEIVLSTFGPSRNFSAPSHRGGVAYSKHTIPAAAFIHIETRLRQQRIDVEEWRLVWGDWIKWGGALGPAAPWEA